MKYLLPALVLLLPPVAAAQSAPADWKPIKDAKGACRISVPPDWTISADTGSAVYQEATVAIAVVTSQPGQTLKPLTDSLLKVLHIPKGKLFENTAKRIYYQDKIARDDSDTTAFSAMVPGRSGTCSSRVTFISSVSEETARKITLTVTAVSE